MADKETLIRRSFSYFNTSKSGKLEVLELKHFIAFEYLMDDMPIKAEDVTDLQVLSFLHERGCAEKNGWPEEDYVQAVTQAGKSVEDLLKLEEIIKKYWESINA